MALALGAVLPLALAVPGRADEAGSARELVARAESDLAKGDGIAAEIRLGQALERGARPEDVAALMGEALIDQNAPKKARAWLEPARFSTPTAARGWRNLGRLERASGNLLASSLAYDKALSAAPQDAGIWVEVGYLRYVLGNHLDGIDAIGRALALEPVNPRVLEAKGNLVRDQYGLAAALPWFEAGLQAAPDDLALLGSYAATLGELDRASEMLAVTRRMLAIDGKNPQALYLQAVLAARAGNVPLARSLLAKVERRLRYLPGAMLLSAALDLGFGQSANRRGDAGGTARPAAGQSPRGRTARRRLLASGTPSQVMSRYGALADSPAASPYLLTVVARAFELRGDRAGAAPLLDRAAVAWSRPIAPERGTRSARCSHRVRSTLRTRKPAPRRQPIRPMAPQPATRATRRWRRAVPILRSKPMPRLRGCACPTICCSSTASRLKSRGAVPMPRGWSMRRWRSRRPARPPCGSLRQSRGARATGSARRRCCGRCATGAARMTSTWRWPWPTHRRAQAMPKQPWRRRARRGGSSGRAGSRRRATDPR